jgi:hypothetical protein
MTAIYLLFIAGFSFDRLSGSKCTMDTILPSDVLTGGWELACYGFTVLAAFFGYLLLPR